MIHNSFFTSASSSLLWLAVIGTVVCLAYAILVVPDNRERWLIGVYLIGAILFVAWGVSLLLPYLR
jgi:hypothetical protein